MSLPTRLFVLISLLFSSLAAAPAPRAAIPLAAAPSNSLALPGGVPCPNDSAFTCITLTVPLDHFTPSDGRTIPVTFAVLQATGSRKGMFVTVTGGPGTSGIAYADDYTATFDPQIPRRFDIVFFDQRGMALSGGLACPNAATAFYQGDGRGKTAKQEAALKTGAQTFSAACASETAHPEWLPYLGTDQAVEDLEQFRKLVGDKKIWLYGESYGTQYAQTYAARHANRLAGLILDGTVDLTLDGFQFLSQQAQAFNDTLTASLRACNDDPACKADMRGNAVGVYDDLAGRLDTRTVPFDFPLANGSTAHRSFGIADLENAAASQVYSEGDRMLFNRALAAYGARGDLAPLIRLTYLALGLDPQDLSVIPDPAWSDAIYYGVECQDYAYPGSSPNQKAEKYLRAGDPVEARIPRLGSIFYGDLPCAYWPNASTRLQRPAPLVAQGVPTLVLGATADPATPVGNGIAVYHRLADGYLITQQGGPHVIYGRGVACVDDLVTAFLVKGQAPKQRETTCDGVVADDYVALAPANASAFANPLAALASAETEINYLPEYYYWDGLSDDSAGCTFGGSLGLAPSDTGYAFTLQNCAFTRNMVLTGTGSYNPDKDKFILDVTTTGRWKCNLKYTRTPSSTKVTGTCDGKKIDLSA